MYGGINLCIVSIGLYKLYSLGLLPLSPADWIDLVPKTAVSNFDDDLIFMYLIQSRNFGVGAFAR
jgi:hypothetical protein